MLVKNRISKNYLRSLFVSLSSILIGTCISSASTIPVTFENGNNRPLGTGFDSRRSLLYNVCVDNLLDTDATPPKPTVELPHGSFDLSLESSQESLSDKLGISMGGRYRTGATTVSASAEFLNQSKSDSFGIAYNYVSEHLYQETLTPSRIRPIRPLPGFAEIVKQRDIFFEQCGDEYVSARDMAARLFVNIHVSFVSKSERNRFAAKFGIESPATSFSADFEKDKSSFSTSNRMTVRVIQVGGDPSRIGRVLCPTNEGDKPDPDCMRNAKVVVDCSFGQIQKCTGMIANAIAYANAQDGENFPAQIKDVKNYSVTKLHTSAFTSLGQPFLAPPRRERQAEFEAATKQLSDIFETQYSLWSYSNKLYTGKSPRLSDRQRNEMEVLQNMHFKNLRRAGQAIENCFDQGYDKCAMELEAVRKYIGLTDQGDIENLQYTKIESLTAPETFVQFCDLADDEHSEIKVTVNTLKSFAINALDKEGANINKGDVCRNLSDWLNARSEIDLSTSSIYKIGSLYPIASLKNLQKLNLKSKAIHSIQALSQLTNLVSLNLDDNYISDLSPLQSLANLEQLSLQNNSLTNDQIQLLKALAMPQGKLVSLDARGNADEISCPLREKNQCKLLNFSNSINSLAITEQCSLSIGHQALALGKDQTIVTGGYALAGDGFYSASIQLVGRDGCSQSDHLLSLGRAGHSMTLLHDGKILIAGGHSATAEIFDPNTLSSTLIASQMSEVRAQHTATLLPDGRVLIVGGYRDLVDFRRRTTNISAKVEIYDPTTGLFTIFGNLSLPRAEHTATLLPDGRVLILGGYSSSKMINTGEVIDAMKGTITVLDEPMQIGRMGHNAVPLDNNRILIIGGYTWGTEESAGKVVNKLNPISNLEIFDLVNESFKKIGEQLLPARGAMQSWVLPDQRVMLVGGEDQGAIFEGAKLTLGSAKNIIQIFDPKTEGIYTVGTLKYARHLFTLTPMGSRSAMVIGGLGDSGAHSSAELLVYRPK